ncbi:MAG: hypothetical protein IKV59_00595 [Lachnospiraceae bacterium]|nr:hypothetical protein [Lachnospiraceae bacterium]
MKCREDYLSDLELEWLIRDVEQSELVGAPPDLAEQIWYRIKTPDKKREFRRYCVRVMTSVAAAIAVVFLLPEVSDSRLFRTLVFSYETMTTDSGYTMLQVLSDDNIFGDSEEFSVFKGGDEL